MTTQTDWNARAIALLEAMGMRLDRLETAWRETYPELARHLDRFPNGDGAYDRAAAATSAKPAASSPVSPPTSPRPNPNGPGGATVSPRPRPTSPRPGGDAVPIPRQPVPEIAF